MRIKLARHVFGGEKAKGKREGVYCSPLTVDGSAFTVHCLAKHDTLDR